MSRRPAQNIIEVSKERIDELNYQRQHPEEFAPISTGIPELDEIIGGLPKSDPFVMVILATKKLGKTTLAMHFADQVSRFAEKKVMYFGLEELRYQFADRMISNKADIHRRKIFMRSLTDTDIAAMYASTHNMNERLIIQDTTFTIDEAVQEMGDCELAIFDNLQLHDRNRIPGSSDREKLEHIGRKFIHYRNELKKSFIVVSQESEKGKAFGSDEILRGMDFGIRVEEVFEEVVNEKGKKVKGDPIDYLRELIVMRARNMGSGSCEVAFDGAHNRIGKPVPVPFNNERFQQLVEGKTILG